MAAGQVVLGIILALCGGASLALAMVTQRYALSYPARQVPILGCALPRNFVWFIGLVIYGIANGLYAVAQLFGPLSLLAGVFTTLLIWNMLFARILLGEELTSPRIYGAVVILVGVIMCIVATPRDVETEFTPQDIRTLSSRAVGAVYICLLLVFVLASIAAICWYEKTYPANPTEEQDWIRNEGEPGEAEGPIAEDGNDEVSISAGGKEEEEEAIGERETGHQTQPRAEPA
eukprot:3158269-Rhodomonas_salina.1